MAMGLFCSFCPEQCRSHHPADLNLTILFIFITQDKEESITHINKGRPRIRNLLQALAVAMTAVTAIFLLAATGVASGVRSSPTSTPTPELNALKPETSGYKKGPKRALWILSWIIDPRSEGRIREVEFLGIVLGDQSRIEDVLAAHRNLIVEIGDGEFHCRCDH